MNIENVPQVTYTYKVVNNDGNIAVTWTGEQDCALRYSYANLPEIIRSPFLAVENLTFYGTMSAEGNRSNLSGELTTGPTSSTAQTVYVRYTTNYLTSMPFHLNSDQSLNVQLNGEYLYSAEDHITLQYAYGDGKRKICDLPCVCGRAVRLQPCAG